MPIQTFNENQFLIFLNKYVKIFYFPYVEICNSISRKCSFISKWNASYEIWIQSTFYE